MNESANNNNKGFTDKVQDNVKTSVNDTTQSMNSIIEKQNNINNNKDATTAQKNTSLAVSGAEGALAGLGALAGAGDQLSSAVMMPIMEKLAGIKGKAILPVCKQTDPVLGIDVHMIVVPPAPAPIPIPHPYIGISFKAKDFIACALATLLPTPDVAPPVDENSDSATVEKSNQQRTKAVMHQVASIAIGILGATVKFGGYLPRTVAGTPSKSIPHFPIGPSFHPVFSRMVEKNHGHALLGSFFVVADGSPITGSPIHLHNDCWDVGIFSIHNIKPNKNADGSKKKFRARLYVPSGVIVPIPWVKPVITNPIPSPINPLEAPKLLFKAAFSKLRRGRAASAATNKKAGPRPCTRTSRGMHNLNNRLFNRKPTRGIYNAVNKAIKKYVGHPVDVATGELFTDNEDFNIAGTIPLNWERVWYSNSDYEGPLGHGWHHSYDMALYLKEDERYAEVRLSDGRLVGFDRIPLLQGQKARFNRSAKLWLCLHEQGYYYIKSHNGLIYHFNNRPISAKAAAIMLSRITGAAHPYIDLHYTSDGILKQIIDTAGRSLELISDAKGRITTVKAPHPDRSPETFDIARYQYDENGNLIIHADAMGQEMQYYYENHLLKKETWRNGHKWYFVYDGEHTGAKCIETWGDGNLLHYKLRYLEGETLSTDSLGHTSKFRHRNKIVYETIDPNGASWKDVYNKYDEVESSSDPLGNTTAYTHDDYGNVATITEADGSFTQMEYLNFLQPWLPTEAVDKRGGKWLWEYDPRGNLVLRKDPLSAITSYGYNEQLLLRQITDPLGSSTKIGYDKDYNVGYIMAPNGATTQYRYDHLGNCVQVTNPNEVLQTRRLDILGRVISINDFDNNIIDLRYDAIDNVIKYTDRQREINYTYKGLWKLNSREEAGATIRYAYDTEEQLRQVINEEGDRYLFELDPAGNVIKETGFDGLTRKYRRDQAGKILEVQRPMDRFTRYDYNEAGQISRVQYHDGSEEHYIYDRGLLQTATNAGAVVKMERDVLGRVVKESSNENWVAYSFDQVGNTVLTSSNLGAMVHNTFDQMGDVVRQEAMGWEATIQRDLLGLEIEKELTGGLKSHWQRDRIGRVRQHTVGKGMRPIRQRQYLWDVNDQLRQITDNRNGITTFEHDQWGNLAQTMFSNGSVQLRNPDRVGNLFETPDRKDRKYDKGGRLLESKTTYYAYDQEGFLLSKQEKGAPVAWRYEWNAAGMLSKVFRPDGSIVQFKYDALGRRISKQFKQTITKFVWSGNKPLHEWKEFDFKEGSADDLITWIFETDSFAPTAKIKGEKKYSIVSDHLGTPTQGYNEDGELIWDRELDSYGSIRMQTGDAGFCNYLYQGQTLDPETGLAYNRFRYYNPEEGMYISQDPIGLAGGLTTLYGYVKDTNIWIDEFGLASSSYPNIGGPLHHIATNKNEKRGKKWTKKFKPFFDKAGLDMDGADNKVYVPGHKGPHPDDYHQHVYDKLEAATNGIDHTKDKQKYQQAVKDALADIAKDAQAPGTKVNDWLLKK